MWTFIQKQVLGLSWFNSLIGEILNGIGLSPHSKATQIVQFFLYDSIKIMYLLCILIFIISYIQSFFPPEKTKRILGRLDGILGRSMGALLGILTPFCSCSSIPIFIGFTSAGLPIGVTLSFLIMSPMADLGSLTMLYTMFGAKIAIAYLITGFAISVVAGTIIEKLGFGDYIEDYIRNIRGQESDEGKLTFKMRIDYARDGVADILKRVWLFILIGVGIGALIHNVIPESVVQGLLGGEHWYSVVIATTVGVPMYADIFGAIPIAEGLLFKGAGVGTVMSFMMSVTALSLPSMIMLRQAMKPKLLAAFIATVTCGIVIIGYLFNVFQLMLI